MLMEYFALLILKISVAETPWTSSKVSEICKNKFKKP